MSPFYELAFMFMIRLIVENSLEEKLWNHGDGDTFIFKYTWHPKALILVYSIIAGVLLWSILGYTLGFGLHPAISLILIGIVVVIGWLHCGK